MLRCSRMVLRVRLRAVEAAFRLLAKHKDGHVYTLGSRLKTLGGSNKNASLSYDSP